MIQEGSIGIEILYQIKNADGTPTDISTATDLKYTIMKPDGTKYEVTPHLDSTGLDGKLTYTTTDPDELTPAGAYYVQPSLNLGLFDGPVPAAMFVVHPNI